LDVRYYIDSQGRTIIEASTGFDPGDQRARVYAPDGYVFDLNFTWPDGGTVSFAIEDEDKSEHFIKVYPNGYSGSVAIALEVKYSAFGASTGWKEKEKYTLNYPINKNQYTAPSVDSFVFAPTEAVLGQQIYVKTKNGVKVTELTSSAKLGASVTKTEWYVGDGSTRYEGAGATDRLLAYGTIPVVAEVTDTRGFKTTKSFNITVHDYFSPSVVPINGANDIKAERSGTAISFAVGRRYASVGGFNKCTLSYKLKAISGTEWEEAKPLLGEDSSLNEYLGTKDEKLDDKTIYYVEITAEDLLGGTESIIVAIPTDEVFMHKSVLLGSLGIGGYATLSKAFEVFLDTHLYNVSQLILTSPGGTKYAVVVDDNGNLSATNADITSLTGEE
jgi:hypothetical protein